MKTFTTEKVRCFAAICFSFIMALSTHAQTGSVPQKMSYQAVVRDGTNSLLANKTVGMRISILQGSEAGSVVYKETHSAATNTNGLVSIAIGGGKAESGVMALIDWSNGPFFVKTEIDPNGGSSYSITSTTQLLTVPFALYAEKAGNAFDGKWESLIEKPNFAEVATSGSYTHLTDKPELSGVATSGSYNDLSDTPELANVATSGKYADLKEIPQFSDVASSGKYGDLKGTPTKVTQLENDAKYLQTEKQKLSLEGTNLSITDKDGEILNTIVLPSTSTGGVTDYEQLTGKPEGTNTGDILYWNSSNKKWNVLNMGVDGQILSISAGKLSWVEPSFIINTEAYEEGEIFYQNGKAEGVIIKSDKMARSGLLLSLNESTLAWSKVYNSTNANNNSNGENNMVAIGGTSGWESNYPAFKFCREEGDSWYLPSPEELKVICDKKEEINAKLTEMSGVLLSQDFYWASAERDVKYAKGIAFNDVSITNPYTAIQADEKYIKTETVKSSTGKDSLVFVSLDIPKGEYFEAHKDTILGVRAIRKLSWSELTSKPAPDNSYNVGDIYYSSDNTTPLGIVYQTSENRAHGKILSLVEVTDQTWSEAEQWCTDIGPAWFIPTEKEWTEIAVLKTMLNTILLSKSQTGLATDKKYWSSTEDTEKEENAQAVTLTTITSAGGIVTDGYTVESTGKTELVAVRAIMEF